MAVFKTKHFESQLQRPRVPPDGTSLEEQMNAFLATLATTAILDVSTLVTHGQSARLVYTGMVIYQV